MLPHIDELLEHWALSRDTQALGWSRRTLLYRVMREGPAGAAIHHPYGPTPPPCDDRAEHMEQAIRALPPMLRQVVRVRYVQHGAEAIKHQHLRLSERIYRNYLNLAHHWIDGWLNGGVHPRPW